MVQSLTATVQSADGTTIGFRQSGDGPGLILLHGGMKSARDLSTLAERLGDGFRVSVPDRRGRGLSGPHGPNFNVQREVEDLQAVLAATDTRFALGHSAGALVVLRTALSTPAIERIALYEPPLSINGSTPTGWLKRFDREIGSGKLVAALVTALKGLRLDPLLARVPRFLLEPALAIGLRFRSPGPDDVGIAELIPTQHFDMQIVLEMADTASDYARLQAPTLLLNGAKSPAYLHKALEELDTVLPNARRVSLAAVGHDGPENDGKPDEVAQILRDFFADS